MSIEYRVGDVFDRLAEIPDGTIDLIVTSPPFLALRSYLPADHPDKHKEIGSEPTPAEFIDTLLALSAEWGRVLAPHGSICVELGDTYAGGGGVVQSREHRAERDGTDADGGARVVPMKDGNGWPLAKSLTGIPTIYPWSLAYGRNLLTGNESPAGQWRIRNVIVWARPNPPVGALGDKFRPATSYITVACKGPKRYFDLDAVRLPLLHPGKSATTAHGTEETHRHLNAYDASQSAGAPPLDWHADQHPEDGDWLWKLSTQAYAGSHYATFPLKLPTRMIEAMCPLKVCRVCGVPSTRIVGEAEYVQTRDGSTPATLNYRDGERGDAAIGFGVRAPQGAKGDNGVTRQAPTLGFTDCGHNDWRTGVVLDPFAGSGTTLQAAQNVGRHAIGIDLDERNAHLARDRVGMFLEIAEPAA